MDCPPYQAGVFTPAAAKRLCGGFFDLLPQRVISGVGRQAPGATLPQDHPEFRDHYRDMGEFPQVALPLKRIRAEPISAFGGFSEPFL
jgi:hypothetical protein